MFPLSDQVLLSMLNFIFNTKIELSLFQPHSVAQTDLSPCEPLLTPIASLNYLIHTSDANTYYLICNLN